MHTIDPHIELSSLDTLLARSHRTRRTRRVVAWAFLGLLGMLLGTVYAAGFPQAGGETAIATPSAARVVDVTGTPAAASLLAENVTGLGDITYSWSGRWGSVPDEGLFHVDLSGETGTYATELHLTNGDALANWTVLQLKLEVAEVASSAACSAPFDFDGTSSPTVLFADVVDASALFTGLSGGKHYCIGLAAADGRDPAGTYLRRTVTGSTPTYPTFVAALFKTA